MAGDCRSDAAMGVPTAEPSQTHPPYEPRHWNERMASILRQAGGVREELERARSTEDARLTKHVSDAFLALIAALPSSADQPGAARDRHESRDVPSGPEPR